MSVWGNEYIQVVHGNTRHVGELIASGTPPFKRGCAMDRSSESACIPGNGNMTGFLAQEVTTDGPSFEDLSFNNDLVAKYGTAVSLVSLEDGGEFEVEGEPSKAYNAESEGLLVTTGTGAITGSSPVDSELTVQNGRWRIAQSGDYVLAILRKQLTPIADVSNIRILCEMRRMGQKKS